MRTWPYERARGGPRATSSERFSTGDGQRTTSDVMTTDLAISDNGPRLAVLPLAATPQPMNAFWKILLVTLSFGSRAAGQQYCFQYRANGATHSACVSDPSQCEEQTRRARRDSTVDAASVSDCVAPPVVFCFQQRGPGFPDVTCEATVQLCVAARERAIAENTVDFTRCRRVPNPVEETVQPVGRVTASALPTPTLRQSAPRLIFSCTSTGYVHPGGRARPIVNARCEVEDLSEAGREASTLSFRQRFAWCVEELCWSNRWTCQVEANGEHCRRVTAQQFDRRGQ